MEFGGGIDEYEMLGEGERWIFYVLEGITCCVGGERDYPPILGLCLLSNEIKCCSMFNFFNTSQYYVAT